MGRGRKEFQVDHREVNRRSLQSKFPRILHYEKAKACAEFLTRLQTGMFRSRGKDKKNDMLSSRLVEADGYSASAHFFDKLIEEVCSDTIDADVSTSYCTSVGWEIYPTGESDSTCSENILAEDVQKVVGAVTAASNVEASVEEFLFKNVSNYTEEKLSDLKMLFTAYKDCQTLQNCGFYQMAFRNYSKLMPFLTCDGLFWLRIAECCIYARYKVNHGCFMGGILEYDIGEEDISFMSLFFNKDIPCKRVQQELDKEGMTLDYAEVALSNCMLLLEGDRNKCLKDHATTLASFISLKSKRFSDSLFLLKKINYTTDPRLILRALLIEAEIDLQEMNKETEEKILNFELLSRTVCCLKESEQNWYPLLLGFITKQEGSSAERMFDVYKKFAKPRSSDLIIGAVMCRKANMMKQFSSFLADLIQNDGN